MSGEPAPEEQFGPYLVYERLGIGGMATVHRALEHSDDGSERIVALKRLLPHLAEDASFIKSFVREAKLASFLNHVNIVQIYELGRVGTEYFISMEYIDGRDLRQLLRHARKVTGPPPIYVTVGLMLQLCDALDYAHNRVDDDGHPLGLVHRDISPSNLIVTSAGQLKVIDFGIAKAQSSQLRTQTGKVKGKLAYIPPEAVSNSRELDARSDIWATGVIMHELVTARPLFASKNEYQTLLKVQRGDIMPPSTFNQSCPAELDAIVFRALARDPDDRFASAAELREELLALKRRYALQTAFKDVASWVDWAFGLEPPDGFAADTSRMHAKTPLPQRNTEEDEAVEVVWGSANNESEDGPVVLEEVPDVSGKVRARRDTEDEGLQPDDIPTPLPTHGTLPSIYGKPGKPALVAVPANNKAPSRGTGPQVPMPARSRVPTGVQPAIAQPAIARTPTGPRTPSPTSPPTVVESRGRRTTAPGVIPAVRGTDRSGPVRMDAIPRERERESTTGEMPSLDAPTTLHRNSTDGDTVLRSDHEGYTTDPVAAPLTPEEAFGQDAAEVLAGVSAQLESRATSASMPSFHEDIATNPTGIPLRERPPTSPPVVRFSRGNTVPPPDQSSPRVPVTRPGVGTSPPLSHLPRLRPGSTTRPPPITPVAIIAPSSSKKALVFIGAGTLLAGATAALVAMSMSGGDEKPAAPPAENAASAAPAPEPPPPPAPVSKVKFNLEPADAEIRIGGANAHVGSPWVTELPPGAYQVEIHRSNYKSWLTTIELSPNETASLRVVLEPITSAVDATLTVSTTPPGLDVYIDGALQSQKSPIKTAIKVGQHKITVKQNGVEVWQQNVNAEASSDYEFNPSFTDAKKRERAQRTSRPHPAPQSGSDVGADLASGLASPDAPEPARPSSESPAAADKPSSGQLENPNGDLGGSLRNQTLEPKPAAPRTPPSTPLP